MMTIFNKENLVKTIEFLKENTKCNISFNY